MDTFDLGYGAGYAAALSKHIRVWVLMEYDHEHDDNRGGSHVTGYYHSRGIAQGLADKYNSEFLEEQNRKAKIVHEKQYAISTINVREHNALVKAGLRGGLIEPVPALTPFMPCTSLIIFTSPQNNPTARSGWCGTQDHYYVEELGFEDDHH